MKPKTNILSFVLNLSMSWHMDWYVWNYCYTLQCYAAFTLGNKNWSKRGSIVQKIHSAYDVTLIWWHYIYFNYNFTEKLHFVNNILCRSSIHVLFYVWKFYEFYDFLFSIWWFEQKSWMGCLAPRDMVFWFNELKLDFAHWSDCERIHAMLCAR